MKIYQTNEIRNIALIGNAGSGKTTLAETMVFASGLIKRRGTIDDKNTLSDYKQIEHEHKASVFSSVLHTEWKDCKINIIDTPGANDFAGGVVSSLYVADAAIMILNSQTGVEVGTQLSWRQTEKLEKPVIFVANHLDHDNTNFAKTIEDIKILCKKSIVIIQYPVNQGVEFNCVIDVLTMKMYSWPKDGGNPTVSEIPAEEKDTAAEYHNALVEAAAENDEKLMEIFFENDNLTEDQMRQGIKKGILQRGLFPVFCSNAKSDMGSRRIMDFIVNVAPSPNESKSLKTTSDEEIVCSKSGSKALFVFKNTVEQHLGEVLFFKVLSGTINEGDDLINTNRNTKERISQLFVTNGKERQKVEEIIAGDIGATIKLKSTKVNQTLCDKSNEFKISEIPFPHAKYRVAIKAKVEADDEKLGDALHKLHDEDPTWILEYSKELKQLIIHSQGEYHINTLKWHLDHEFKIASDFFAPKIPYRETITKPAQADYRHKKQSGGAGQFGEVHLIIEPYIEGKDFSKTFKIDSKEYVLTIRDTKEFELNWGGKLVFHNCIVGGVIDANYMPAIVKGLMEKMEFGPLTGSYARDIRVYVYDGKMHQVDSNEISFKLAGSKAFSDAFKIAGPKLLEPIYDVDVMVPGDRMGDVMSDLQGRRAIIQGMGSEQGMEKIMAKVPLSEMNKYATALSSLTNGRASFEMSFAEYSPVPGDIQDKLIKKYEEEEEND